ncbi:ribose-phosphate pyrophosphokinase [Sodiomyces alkalinus F11]|uniref:Ribose-phosphate pyrophosphokinase 1 n=1 Tax=Sodiomyces alkalinus (strain CBS 110278 / VKM F-3762 / F11) TaxID=1314773 RepID=A0A3N2Q5D8_SODAK|nr:ribose-phosphate pyrophosphokinase [Sodiomyces alkalinus F11]ROT41845.1 ribose-phosphate pyrophosphokinase [Sodiomyces alkalinus F11]
MRGTLIFSGSSCPALTAQLCENLGTRPGNAELSQFSNGETSVRILTSIREKDVFIVQSGSPKVNDTIMELLIMISACKGGSANKITAVLPYFPYSRQSKKKSQRGAITARMLANLLIMAGVKHVITVDLHASQMQGFFKCPVDNLHAEPLIARWIRHNVPNWREAVVVSKNAGGTKRVTSLADALKLNFGMVTTEKKRGNMCSSVIISPYDSFQRQPALETFTQNQTAPAPKDEQEQADQQVDDPPPATTMPIRSRVRANTQGSPQRTVGLGIRAPDQIRSDDRSITPTQQRNGPDGAEDSEYDDGRAHEVTQGRLIRGHIVDDDFPSPSTSTADGSVREDSDPMTMSHASSFFAPAPAPHALGGSGDASGETDDEEAILKDPKIEHTITLVGDVKRRTVLIVDDMIDKPGSWIAAAETVVKKGRAKKVYCIATHGVFGGDCLEQMQNCECIDTIVVTNSFPIREEQVKNITKLVILDLSFLLAEAIRRNHYGESISPLYQHIVD